MKFFDDIWRQSHWFAIQTKPYQEALASRNVAQAEVEVFFPRARQRQPVGGIARWVNKALFASYFFARFAPVERIDVVRYAGGVLRVVGTSQFPIPIEPGMISELRARATSDDGCIQLETMALSPGSSVRVEEGPFAGFVGRVESECDDGKRVAILLEVLQHARLVIDKRCITAPVLA